MPYALCELCLPSLPRATVLQTKNPGLKRWSTLSRATARRTRPLSPPAEAPGGVLPGVSAQAEELCTPLLEGGEEMHERNFLRAGPGSPSSVSIAGRRGQAAAAPI